MREGNVTKVFSKTRSHKIVLLLILVMKHIVFGTVHTVFSIPDLTSVYSRLSFAQPFCHWLGNHPVQKVVSLLHFIVQHLHTLLQLTGLLLLLHSQQGTGTENTESESLSFISSLQAVGTLGLLEEKKGFRVILHNAE